jgi:hypothetical protein
MDIGALDAENDAFLETAFLVRDDYYLLSNTKQPHRIILGRTGSGKSALIRRIESMNPRVARISPEAISLRHLSNSDIIQYFYKLDVKLDLFYKVMWKHVFIVELIKLRFKNDMNKSVNFLEWIKKNFPDKKRQRAIKYLEDWEDRFFQDTEYQIREMETSIEKRFRAETGVKGGLLNVLTLKGGSEAEQKVHDTIRAEVLHKAQKVIHESQIPELDEIISLMREELFKDDQKKYFLVIDDLDKDWVSEGIVYDLIKALIETVKDLSTIPNVKIILALRSNIHRRIFHENTTRGVQREKYNHLYLKLSWTKENLIDLLNRRLEELMRGYYTKSSPKVSDVLPIATGKSISGIDYMLERTFYRPRDIIDFFNKCIVVSDGKTKFTRESIRQAEAEYSTERLHAIEDEWAENYGLFKPMVELLEGGNVSFTLTELISRAENHFVELLSTKADSKMRGAMAAMLEQFKSAMDTESCLKDLLVVLYEIGIIGVKKSSDTIRSYSYEQFTHLDSAEIHHDTKFYVHPMFFRALKIKNVPQT